MIFSCFLGMKITIIGISDSVPEFTAKEQGLIQSVQCFAGGSRHKQLVADFLPAGSCWHDIVVPLTKLYQAMEDSRGDWVVFASGDPLFYGIGITLKRVFPTAEIDILPDFNSLQLLAHQFQLPYGEFQTVSLTGRSFDALDKALIQGRARMGILTDRKNTPVSIAQHMLDYGYANYCMYFGECLGGENQRVLKLSLEEAVKMTFRHPNCFFLEKTDDVMPVKGIPENVFEPLVGRPKMITKMPIRMATLAFMELNAKKVFWDVGACTGSVSIDARLNHPHLKVIAFEIREESQGIIHRNVRKFKAPGIEVLMGDYLQVQKNELKKPDAVFLGGYGGRMEAVLDDIHLYLRENGIVAFNSVSEGSQKRFVAWCHQRAYQLTQTVQMSVDQFNPITILIAQKPDGSEF